MDMDASGKLDVSIRLYHGTAAGTAGTAGTPGFHGCGGESSPLIMSHGDSWWFNEIFLLFLGFYGILMGCSGFYGIFNRISWDLPVIHS